MRRTVAIAVIAIFFLASLCLLAGCGGSQTDQGKTTGAQTPKVILLTSPGCSTCELAKPVVHELEKEMAGKIEFEVLDTDKEPEKSARYGAQVVPTLLILDGDGKVVHTITGFSNADDYKKSIRAYLEELLS